MKGVPKRRNLRRQSQGDGEQPDNNLSFDDELKELRENASGSLQKEIDLGFLWV